MVHRVGTAPCPSYARTTILMGLYYLYYDPRVLVLCSCRDSRMLHACEGVMCDVSCDVQTAKGSTRARVRGRVEWEWRQGDDHGHMRGQGGLLGCAGE